MWLNCTSLSWYLQVSGSIVLIWSMEVSLRDGGLTWNACSSTERDLQEVSGLWLGLEKSNISSTRRGFRGAYLLGRVIGPEETQPCQKSAAKGKQILVSTTRFVTSSGLGATHLLSMRVSASRRESRKRTCNNVSREQRIETGLTEARFGHWERCGGHARCQISSLGLCVRLQLMMMVVVLVLAVVDVIFRPGQALVDPDHQRGRALPNNSP